MIALTVPPLRQRHEDILQLGTHYLHYFERRQGRPGLSFSARCEAAIQACKWPGNLRELRSAVERAVILSPASIIEPQDLGLDAGAPGFTDEANWSDTGENARSRATPTLGGNASMAEIEREHIARVVAAAPSLEAAAQILAIDPTTLQRKRKRYGLA